MPLSARLKIFKLRYTSRKTVIFFTYSERRFGKSAVSNSTFYFSRQSFNIMTQQIQSKIRQTSLSNHVSVCSKYVHHLSDKHNTWAYYLPYSSMF
jgi:hypothetical protein